jgi:hypothetical protein
MKKSILFAIIIAVGILLTSCKKDYECICKSDAFGFSNEISNVKTDVPKRKVKELEKDCTNGSGTASFSGFTVTTTCTWKAL